MCGERGRSIFRYAQFRSSFMITTSSRLRCDVGCSAAPSRKAMSAGGRSRRIIDAIAAMGRESVNGLQIGACLELVLQVGMLLFTSRCRPRRYRARRWLRCRVSITE